MKNIGVVGAGSWGTALAITLSGKGHQVKIWDLDETHLKELDENRENVRYLPGIKFNDNLKIAFSVEEALDGADIVLFSAPAQHFRSALKGALPYLKENMVAGNVAKGIEQGSLMRMSEIAGELAPDLKYVVLSGPSHAEEVGLAMPTTVAVASADIKLAEYIQEEFMTDRFRIYTANDVVGIELGGSLKNIIALGAGISDGMGYGDNAKAALMTRGLTEMARLGEKLGGSRLTFMGLAGLGDLIVTCTSMHSRNRRCGIMIGEGLDPAEAVRRVGMVVEGVNTTEAVHELAEQLAVEMPITEQLYQVIKGTVKGPEAVRRLMLRERKNESEY